MEIKGKIKRIGSSVVYGSTTVREMILTTEEQYPQTLSISFINDKATLLDSYGEGAVVNVAINLRGKEHNGKYYTNINGWKIGTGDEVSNSVQNADRGADDLMF